MLTNSFLLARRGRLLRTLLPVLVIVVAVAGVIVTNQEHPPCEGELPLRVIVTPAVQQITQEAATAFEHDHAAVNGLCAKVRVVAEGSADLVQALPTRPVDPPALWIPDSSLWVAPARAIVQNRDLKLDEHPSLASSPLVVAASADQARALGFVDTPVSWQRLVDGKTPFAITDPLTNTEGLVTVGLAQPAMAQQDSAPSPALISVLLPLRQSTLDSVADGYRGIRDDPKRAPLFTATEQSVEANNATKAVAIYPTDGTVLFDYPVVRVTTGGEATGTEQAAAAFERELRSARSMGLFSAAGFRDQRGVATTTLSGTNGVRAVVPSLRPKPSATQISAVQRAWNQVRLDAKALIVVDVSGSMNERLSDGRQRIEVARDGVFTSLKLMSDASEIGLWAFSIQQAPPNDWAELVPQRPLGGTVGRVTQREAVQQQVNSLGGRVRGATALYDTVLAAYQAQTGTFSTTKINSVLLITDGRNEKDGGLSLGGLLRRLRAAADPARPVQITGIGLGPDADIGVLTQIAATTGGNAYQALDGTAFRNVLFDAVSHWPCRTNNC